MTFQSDLFFSKVRSISIIFCCLNGANSKKGGSHYLAILQYSECGEDELSFNNKFFNFSNSWDFNSKKKRDWKLITVGTT